MFEAWRIIPYARYRLDEPPSAKMHYSEQEMKK